MTGVSKREGLEVAVASLSLVAGVKAKELVESSVEVCCSSEGISLASSVSSKNNGKCIIYSPCLFRGNTKTALWRNYFFKKTANREKLYIACL